MIIESKLERDYRRQKTIEAAVSAADEIILAEPDGTTASTDYLTASVAQWLLHKALLPLRIQTNVIFWREEDKKREIVQNSVQAAVKAIYNGGFNNEEEANFMLAEVAKEFSKKSLRPFHISMIKKDLEINHGMNGNNRKKETVSSGNS